MKHTPHGYWLEEAGKPEAAPPLAGDVAADVIVVGGGYTGMWAAWHLKQLEPEAPGRPARGRAPAATARAGAMAASAT